MRAECRLIVFENRVLSKTPEVHRVEITRGAEDYLMRGLMICTSHQILLG
jgi:hypothetical protein